MDIETLTAQIIDRLIDVHELIAQARGADITDYQLGVIGMIDHNLQRTLNAAQYLDSVSVAS